MLDILSTNESTFPSGSRTLRFIQRIMMKNCNIIVSGKKLTNKDKINIRLILPSSKFKFSIKYQGQVYYSNQTYRKLSEILVGTRPTSTFSEELVYKLLLGELKTTGGAWIISPESSIYLSFSSENYKIDHSNIMYFSNCIRRTHMIHHNM